MVSDQVLRAAVRKALKGLSHEELMNVSVKDLRKAVATEIGLEAAREAKERIKELAFFYMEKVETKEKLEQAALKKKAVKKLTTGGKKAKAEKKGKAKTDVQDNDSDNAFDSADSILSSNVRQKMTKMKNKTLSKRSKLGSSNSGNANKDLAVLGVFIKAAGIGPSIYKGLSSSGPERVAELLEALAEHGSWPFAAAGRLPTSKEIAKTKKEHALRMELDGIDPSNIVDVDSRRPRRRSSALASAGRFTELSSEDEDEADSTTVRSKLNKSKNTWKKECSSRSSSTVIGTIHEENESKKLSSSDEEGDSYEEFELSSDDDKHPKHTSHKSKKSTGVKSSCVSKRKRVVVSNDDSDSSNKDEKKDVIISHSPVKKHKPTNKKAKAVLCDSDSDEEEFTF